MNRLAVPVASITAGGLVIDVVVPFAEIEPPDARGGAPVLTVNVRGTLSEAGNEYFFRGTISGAFEHVCDRCLASMSAPFAVEAAWVFKEGLRPAADDDVQEADAEDLDEPAVTELGFEGSEIDLGPGVWEEVVLAMPLKFVCGPECAGLCARCGANLNRGRCTCREQDSDPIGNKGLAGLSELFPDLRPKRSED